MKKFLFSMLILVSQIASATKTVIISDIDDTIKRSHILGSKLSALKTRNQFVGMSDLYSAFLCNNEVSTKAKKFCIENRATTHDSKRWISYVTGAPGKLQLLGREFLNDSSFPQGTVFGRTSHNISTLDFKYKKIATLVNGIGSENDFILIGDNGEHDPKAYQKIKNKYGSNIKTYIHMVYSTSFHEDDERGVALKTGQVAYLTAADLALEFYALNYINEDDLITISIKVKNNLYSENEDLIETVIPEWVKCENFVLSYKRPNIRLSSRANRLLKQIETRTKSICMMQR